MAKKLSKEAEIVIKNWIDGSSNDGFLNTREELLQSSIVKVEVGDTFSLTRKGRNLNALLNKKVK